LIGQNFIVKIKIVGLALRFAKTEYLYRRIHLTKRDEIKSEIERIFSEFVKGEIPDLTGFNKRHDGAEGDWLTKKILPKQLLVIGLQMLPYTKGEILKSSVITSLKYLVRKVHV
jgi:hypothetical protein